MSDPTVDEWMEAEIEISEFGQPRTVKTIDYFAELVAVNGGLSVHGYGMISYGGGGYGRQGLDMGEADMLKMFDGVLTGIRLADPDKAQTIVERIKAIMDAKALEPEVQG